MRVGSISLVVKTLVLADYNPEVCSCVNHEVPTSPELINPIVILTELAFKDVMWM
jgi:hypothetical protein